jgi:hypothetical protein
MVACSHEGFHSIRSCYDRRHGVLVYYWTCDVCGTWLGELRRIPYRPHLDERGSQRFFTVLNR